jgi:hypothetical protein
MIDARIIPTLCKCNPNKQLCCWRGRKGRENLGVHCMLCALRIVPQLQLPTELSPQGCSSVLFSPACRVFSGLHFTTFSHAVVTTITSTLVSVTGLHTICYYYHKVHSLTFCPDDRLNLTIGTRLACHSQPTNNSAIVFCWTPELDLQQHQYNQPYFQRPCLKRHRHSSPRHSSHQSIIHAVIGSIPWGRGIVALTFSLTTSPDQNQ